MKRDLVVSLVLLAGVVCLYLSLSLMEEPRAAAFPRVVILIMGALSLALLIQSLLAGYRGQGAASQPVPATTGKQTDGKKPFPLGTLVGCFVMIVIYFAIMEWLGFYLSAFLFFVAVTFLFGRRELTIRQGVSRIGIAMIFTGVLFVLFNRILVVQTPKGLLF